MPSVLVAVTVVGPEATATNVPFPKATVRQLILAGSVLAVHVMPSELEAALDEPSAMAT
jgi:hypothetical protein